MSCDGSVTVISIAREVGHARYIHTHVRHMAPLSLFLCVGGACVLQVRVWVCLQPAAAGHSPIVTISASHTGVLRLTYAQLCCAAPGLSARLVRRMCLRRAHACGCAHCVCSTCLSGVLTQECVCMMLAGFMLLVGPCCCAVTCC